MEKGPPEMYKLNIKTSDIASEIFVIDGQFNRVGKSAGEISSFMLPKGLYSVKVKVGDEYIEEPVTLTKNKTIEFSPVVFESAVPIAGTFNTSGFQIETASSYSKKQRSDVVLGKGSSLFLFGSIPFETPELSRPDRGQDPAVGLTLRNFNNKVLVDFGRPDVGTYNWEDEPWAACDIDLDPGNYVLCVQTSDGRNYKRSLVTCSGWQTQVFLQPRNYGVVEKDVRADLTNSSVLMSQIKYGFNPGEATNFKDGTNYKLTEQVHQALKCKRNAISDNLLSILLSDKLDNPMLGIYGAHLLLHTNASTEARIVVENLRKLLGYSHPDVEALALGIGLSTDHLFTEFPMLASSWSLVVEGSAQNPELVPENSAAYKHSDQFWSSEFWLLWGNENKTGYSDYIQRILLSLQQLSGLKTSDKLIRNVSEILSVVRVDKTLTEQLMTSIAAGKISIPRISQDLHGQKLADIAKQIGIPYHKIQSLIRNSISDHLRSSIETMDFPKAEISGDGQKGKWGGESISNFRELTASIAQSKKSPRLFDVTLKVVSTKDARPIKGEVRFHLHETFLNPSPVVAARHGKAKLKLKRVWGAFTVGVEADSGATRLELDLSELEGAPAEFKRR